MKKILPNIFPARARSLLLLTQKIVRRSANTGDYRNPTRFPFFESTFLLQLALFVQSLQYGQTRQIFFFSSEKDRREELRYGERSELFTHARYVPFVAGRNSSRSMVHVSSPTSKLMLKYSLLDTWKIRKISCLR